MRWILSFAMLSLLAQAPASAAEPSGCDRFKWSVATAQAALTAADQPRMISGAQITPSSSAVTLALKPADQAALPVPPERERKPGSYAGFANYASAGKPGLVSVNISTSGWVDVIQNGQTLKPADFSGAKNCAGIRKSIKYDLGAGPFTVQISGVDAESASVVVLPFAP